ncbi:class I SAM-dependent methyltransferase [Catalinimonas niigatensis]|uniref:class I SAM-dependent methyltransferase n=1 Tax=Catalinimonas niigatensis TaxID=1397264 RepID=UPI0026665656|nr:class I SAM-dependent methyltransferase [Catalinimonas niigatensis]WPP49377.1 class I SAM-dependent methyltransferase [Catalinimonas niigatensis]
MKSPPESSVLRSWNLNAHRWNTLIDEEKLESRRLVTNQSIVEVLQSLPTKRMLDVGCGEGWLVRRMNEAGREYRGVDGSEMLIKLAQDKGQGNYQCLSYENIIQSSAIEGTPFEGIVLNFALFTKEGAAELLCSLRNHLIPKGKLIIQSLHPEVMPQGWEPDVWQGLPDDFVEPYAWYQRSMQEWKELFEDCHLTIENLHEPVHPHTQNPLSVIFVLTCK